MKTDQNLKVFGTVLRTRVLTTVALTGETFAAEVARLTGNRLFPVQRVLDSLEREALVVSRKSGVERRFTLNPRFFARSELRALLLRLGEQDRRSEERRGGKECR